MLRLDLTQWIEQQIEVYLSNINTNMPAKIVSYDAKRNRAIVKPNMPKSIASGDVLESPKVVEVPLVFHSSGNGKASLTFPMTAGDGVMLAVQQRSLENWLDGNNQAPDDPRQFDISDSVAFPGCQSAGIIGDPDNVVLKFDKTNVTITPNNTIIIGNDKGSISIDQNGNIILKGQSVRVDTPAAAFNVEVHRHKDTPSNAGQTSGPPAPG